MPGSEGEDAIVLYANRFFTQMTRLTQKELIGKRVSNYFVLDANEWIGIAVRAGMEGKSFRGKFYDGNLKCDIDMTAYPVIGPGFCACTFQKKNYGLM